jgi:site-specific DNA-adenine methylase
MKPVNKVLGPLFPFYGSKWKAAPKYPEPVYKKLYEPFAGSACYALRHYRCDVVLNDLDPVLSRLWKYLINATRKDILDLPSKFTGSVRDLDIPKGAQDLIGFWLVKAASRPAETIVGWGKGGKYADQYWGKERQQRIADTVQQIGHWEVTNLSYEQLPDEKATWFIDPPYQAPCGRAYVKNQIDFAALAKWCKARRGQVIVCEQDGADWLPFEHLGEFRTVRERSSKEVVFSLKENA